MGWMLGRVIMIGLGVGRCGWGGAGSPSRTACWRSDGLGAVDDSGDRGAGLRVGAD